MNCESCNKPDIPIDNIQRVCAYQIDGHFIDDYGNTVRCDCCDTCRTECHVALVDYLKNNPDATERTDNKA